jgi:hypothetical protein
MPPTKSSNPKTVATVRFQPIPPLNGGLEIISEGSVGIIGTPPSSMLGKTGFTLFVGGKDVVLTLGGAGLSIL